MISEVIINFILKFAGVAAADQVARQGAEQEPVGADGGCGETGAVPHGDVRRGTR